MCQNFKLMLVTSSASCCPPARQAMLAMPPISLIVHTPQCQPAQPDTASLEHVPVVLGTRIHCSLLLPLSYIELACCPEQR